MKTTAVGVAALSAGASAVEESAPKDGPYVDVHTHITQGWAPQPDLSADDLLRWMDQNNIEKAVVLPLVSPESWYYLVTPDEVLRATAAHRDRLIPFCAIDPRTNYLTSYEAKRDLLKRYVDAGARGFGEHKAGVAMDDPRNIEMFAAATELKLPILFHIDNDRNMDTPGLPALARVLEQTPNGIFIGHANGWWASISGDCTQQDMGEYPKRPTTPGGAIDVLMDKYPNIYGDLSAGSGANAILRDPAFGCEFLIRRCDRLLFGTDYLSRGQHVPQLTMFAQLDLPADVKAKIFHDNAHHLFDEHKG